MSKIDYERVKKIRNGEPIEESGLLFYPITMDRYEEFLNCKQVIELRLNTLPVKYMGKDYINAIALMELDAIQQTGKAIGIFSRLAHFICLSLRIDLSPNDRNEMIQFGKENNEIVVKNIILNQNGNQVKISPLIFSKRIRKLLAEQNGLTLPDESINPDIIRDYEELKEYNNRNQKSLNINIDDLIASVSVNINKSMSEIYNMTIREFELIRKAISRNKNYQIYSQAGLSGLCKIDKNPFISWEFDVLDDSFGMTALSESNIKGLVNNDNN